MGNNIGGGKKRAKIMKIDGQTFKLKLPATAMNVLKDYPAGYVLLESEAVKKYGIRAPQLQPEEELKPKKLYFLVEMPMLPGPRSARERMEGLMRRHESATDMGSGDGRVRVKMRIPRAQIEKLMEESKDEAEVAERILHLCLQNSSSGQAAFVFGD